MKRILLFATTVLFLAMAFLMPCVTAHAGGYDLQEHYEKMKAKRAKQEREYMEKWLDDLKAAALALSLILVLSLVITELTQRLLDRIGKEEQKAGCHIKSGKGYGQ